MKKATVLKSAKKHTHNKLKPDSRNKQLTSQLQSQEHFEFDKCYS